MAPIPPPSSAEPSDTPDAYVGLAADDAERRARERGWSTVRSLPPGAIITMEYLSGRLNLEVTDGRVTRSWKG
ncbi:I78 family peptidase inhibitor [Streptomyces sp. NPDC002701]|uniref:I78 family peptidase inhibitor n=1 Tax=unclassified Streptomyces TaxID=2593676 RepID=UPI00367706BE